MSSSDLWAEFSAAYRRAEQSPIYQRLTSLVGTDNILKSGGVGVASIITSGSTFQMAPDDFGAEAVVLKVFAGAIPTPWCWPPEPCLVDLLAFRLDQPSRLWLRRDVGVILGDQRLDDLWLDEPLRIYRDPVTWLGAGCNGVVIIGDDTAARRELPIGLRGIVAEDANHGRDLCRRLTRPAQVPEVFIPRLSKAA